MPNKEMKRADHPPRSKDDLDPAIQKQRLETARGLYNKELEEKIDTPSIFSKAITYLSNLLIVQPMNSIKNSISAPINTVMSFINPVLENPIVMIATSSPVSRAAAMVFGASAVTAAVTVGTLPAAITGVVGGLSAVAAGAATLIDIKKVDTLKKLEKEYGLLVRYRNAKNKQDLVFEIDPNLSITLNNDLSIINSAKTQNKVENQNSKIPLIVNPKKMMLSNMGGVADIVEKSVGVLAGNLNMYSLVYSSVMTGYSLVSSNMNIKQFEELKNTFQLAINDELNKNDTPRYGSNIVNLENICQKQIIQTESIVQLVTSPNYWQNSEEERKKMFYEIRDKIIETKEEPKALGRIDDIKDLITAAMQANNPYYKLPNKIDNKTNLSKVVNKKADIPVPDTIKHKLQKNLSAPNGSTSTKKLYVEEVKSKRKKINRRHSI